MVHTSPALALVAFLLAVNVQLNSLNPVEDQERRVYSKCRELYVVRFSGHLEGLLDSILRSIYSEEGKCVCVCV